ncbi:hypothetical protein AMI01nite_19070 [Aneurinibacillus migulanus]|nr:hypothetical protein AMI01nite_19070 [Aneurinibacillus migulanus]
MFSKQSGLEPLKGEYIARAIRYAIEQSTSVSINEIIVRPSTQP